jgi:AI-2 transport protein TqsA
LNNIDEKAWAVRLLLLNRSSGMNIPDANRFTPASRSLITGAALIILALGLRQMAVVCNAAFLALVITIMFMPLVNRLKRRGWSGSLASGLVILLTLVTVMGVVLLLIYSAGQLVSTLPGIQTPLSQQTGNINAFFTQYNIDVSSATVSIEKLAVAGLNKAGDSLSNIGELLATFGMAFLISVFMLLESDSFSSLLGRQFGSDSQVATSFSQFMQETRDFMRVTTILGLLEGALLAIVLAVIGVPLPLIWGVLFWLLNYIPYIGFWLSLLPPVLLAWLTLGWQYALLVLVIYVVVSNVSKLVIMPKIMGNKVDTSMTVGILGLFFWGWVFGVMGMLLAYPYTLLMRDVMLTNSNELWLVELMRKGSPPASN